MPGLLSPLEICRLRLKNRLVMPPMSLPAANMRGADDRGEVNERHVEHYAARARAGVGLIIVEASHCRLDGIAYRGQPGLHADYVVPGLRQLADAVHQAGSAIAIQIIHAGGKAPRPVIGEQPCAPSALVTPGEGGDLPRALPVLEIRDLVAQYGQAARRAVEAGFDAVEIHGAHGYLLSQFMSPLTNLRDDEYGGDEENRLRFPLAIVRETRRVVGPDYPIFYRFGADDLMEGGITAADGQRIARRLVEAGVDVLDVSGGLGGGGFDRYKEQGFFVPLAHGVKVASGALVVGVGNITEAAYADRVIRAGLVDLVAIGRPLLRDAGWAERALRALAG